MQFDRTSQRIFRGLAALVFTSSNVYAQESERQSLDNAWWTGPILAASAGSLPKGHTLIEPYVFDVIARGRYDDNGNYRDADTVHSWGSLTYILYGVTDEITAGLIPTFGYNDVSAGRDSSGVGFGDLTLQAQYRFSQFSEGRAPTMSFVIQETLPTGNYDRLGDMPTDGFGSGVYSTTLALFSQYYFWMPNGRILRTRFNIAYSLPDSADVTGTSVYGTGEGFTGHAHPGDTLAITSAFEYSFTQNWVLALDLYYQRDDSTRVSGMQPDASGTLQPFERNSGSSWRFAVVPGIEYNFNGSIGVIAGARWFAAGHNTSASVTPVFAVNMVF